MRLLDAVRLFMAIAIYPIFRCLLSLRHDIEMLQWTMLDTFAFPNYPHEGEPYAEVPNRFFYYLIMINEVIWRSTDGLLRVCESIIDYSLHAHTVLWLFPVSHYALGPDYFGNYN